MGIPFFSQINFKSGAPSTSHSSWVRLPTSTDWVWGGLTNFGNPTGTSEGREPICLSNFQKFKISYSGSFVCSRTAIAACQPPSIHVENLSLCGHRQTRSFLCLHLDESFIIRILWLYLLDGLPQRFAKNFLGKLTSETQLTPNFWSSKAVEKNFRKFLHSRVR